MKTPEEIKKGLECCILETDDTSLVDHCRACPYQPTGLCFRTLLNDTLAYINQLEDGLFSNTVFIAKLKNILGKYPNAATNGCAYEAYMEIKMWQHEPPKED